MFLVNVVYVRALGSRRDSSTITTFIKEDVRHRKCGLLSEFLTSCAIKEEEDVSCCRYICQGRKSFKRGNCSQTVCNKRLKGKARRGRFFPRTERARWMKERDGVQTHSCVRQPRIHPLWFLVVLLHHPGAADASCVRIDFPSERINRQDVRAHWVGVLLPCGYATSFKGCSVYPTVSGRCTYTPLCNIHHSGGGGGGGCIPCKQTCRRRNRKVQRTNETREREKQSIVQHASVISSHCSLQASKAKQVRPLTP